MFFAVIVIAAFIIACVYFSKKEKSAPSATSEATVRDNRYATMPTDAHDLVERLAQLMSFVYRNVPQYVKESEFAKGQLYIFKQQDGSYKLSFWYDWDYSVVQSMIENSFELDQGFSFQDDGWIKYETLAVENVDTWICSPWTTYNVAGVVATLENNCPGLYVAEQNIYKNGFNLGLRYR